jgi:hypothetical protein
MISSQSADDPGARWGHAFVYDPIRDEVLLFGGGREAGSFLSDTWTWNGNSWKHHDVTAPPSRGFAAAAFHTGRGTVILHGGRGAGQETFSDTWEWDGSLWRELEVKGPYQSDHHQMVYVEHEGEMMAFGGWDGQDVSGATWIWDGVWKQVSVQGPRKRGAFAMTYDTQEERAILFGGLWLDGQYADLWQWQNRLWEQLGGPYDNSSVDHQAMTYDIRRQQVIMFGGKNYRYRPLGKTQTIERSKVMQLTAEGPTPRHSLGLTYDSRRSRAMLYGGKEYRGELQVALSDLWSWDGERWQLERQ